MMAPRAVVFDLDGTLLDTLEDIAASANRVLVGEGLPTHPPDDYRQFIGEGVAMLFRRALPLDQSDEARIARCVEAFRAEYDRGWNVRTRPYDGIPALLDALSGRELPLAVLSNKPDDFTRRCVAAFFPSQRFAAVLGAREGVPRKPDPAGASEIARALDIPPGAFLYVGDSAVDMETARRGGMRPIGVAWGFRSVEELRAAGAEAILARPDELLTLL